MIRVEVGVTQFVVSFRGVGPQLQGTLVSSDGFIITPLLNLAVTDFNPRFRSTRIAVGCSFEIVAGAVIVPQPQRINTTAVPKLCQYHRLSNRLIPGINFIKSSQGTTCQRRDARRTQREIDLLSVRNFDGNNTEHLAAHVEERA